MSLSKQVYEKVADDESSDGGEEYPFIGSNASRATSRISSLQIALLVFVFISSNVFTWYLSAHKTIYVDKTRYAQLDRDVVVRMDGHDQYTDRNETFRDELWKNINIDDGMVALPDEYVEKMGLMEAQRFPWDHSKGIYLLHGHHNLHCTRAIYISLMEYRNGLPQSRNYRHIIHCLDALRRDVLCNADDTPRLTSNNSIPETGHGQSRTCRSWDKLNDWAKQYNSCYRYINETQTPDEFPQIQRFVWCPEGSPYKEEVAKYFNVPDEEEW